jgi:hypothetical protein
MFFEGKIKFNSEWVASITLDEFKEHEKHHGLTDKQLKEAYDMCKAMQKASRSVGNYKKSEKE